VFVGRELSLKSHIIVAQKCELHQKTGATSFHRVIVLFDGFDILSQLLFPVKRFFDEISITPQNLSFCVLLLMERE